MVAELRHECFAITSPGLEEVTARELASLTIAPGRKIRGGVEFRATLSEAARCNLWSRSASRILLRIGAFDAPGRRELAARAARLPLASFIPPGTPVRIQASSAKSRLYHTGLITEVISDALQTPVTKSEEAPALSVRIERDRCTVSIDTSGDLLHRRGYREETSHAPLRETLAAGMLLLRGYDGSLPFLDPMCGSGTIAIEAAWIAAHRAPGLDRSFALERFPAFDSSVMERLRQEARAAVRAPAHPIFASDRHAGALAAAQRNAGRAGVAIAFERRDVRERSAPAPKGLLLTNPPYGKRIGHDDDDDAARALAAGLDGAFAAWSCAALLPRSARIPTARKVRSEHALDNGGIPVRLVEWAP